MWLSSLGKVWAIQTYIQGAVTICMDQAAVADDRSQEPWGPSMASSHQHLPLYQLLGYLLSPKEMPQGVLPPLELTRRVIKQRMLEVTGTEIPALPATAQQYPGQCWCLVTHFTGHEQWRQSTAMGMHCSVSLPPPSTGTQALLCPCPPPGHQPCFSWPWHKVGKQQGRKRRSSMNGASERWS